MFQSSKLVFNHLRISINATDRVSRKIGIMYKYGSQAVCVYVHFSKTARVCANWSIIKLCTNKIEDGRCEVFAVLISKENIKSKIEN